MTNHDCCAKRNVNVQHISLDDGRLAERHFSLDDEGNEVVEIFAEDKRPKKLEKRILRKFKKVVDQEIEEDVRDGEVTKRDVRALNPDKPLQLVESIATADHAKLVDGDYVRKEEVSNMVSDAVVAGVSALMDHIEPIQEEVHHYHYEKAEEEKPAKKTRRPRYEEWGDDDDNYDYEPVPARPVFRAQSQVANNVADKKKNDGIINAVMGGILVVQVVFFIYMLLFVL